MSNITNNISWLDNWRKNKLAFGILIFYSLLVLLGYILDSNSWASQVNVEKSYLPPFREMGHFLGTDALGRDVLAGLINGAKISFLISFTSTVLAFVTGLFFGLVAGYFQNEIRAHWLCAILLIVFSFLSIFYLIYGGPITSFVFLLFLMATAWTNSTLSISKKNVRIPLDGIIMKVIELFRSIPGILLVIFLLSLTDRRSAIFLIFILVIYRWSGIARIVRAETIKLKNTPFIQSVESIGLSKWRLFWSHYIPNMLSAFWTLLIYGMIASILVESTLSFLGLGLSFETVSWGSILNASRDYFSAWWLAVFPGIALFLVIYSLRTLVRSKEDEWEYLYL